MQGKTPEPKPTTVILTAADQAAVEEIVAAGWATNQTGAIRYALRQTVEELRKAQAGSAA